METFARFIYRTPEVWKAEFNSNNADILQCGAP